jgi:hypothetical protein
MKQIGMLFGEKLLVDTDDEQKVKMATNWLEDLEARERRVRSKEIENDLALYPPKS